MNSSILTLENPGHIRASIKPRTVQSPDSEHSARGLGLIVGIALSEGLVGWEEVSSRFCIGINDGVGVPVVDPQLMAKVFAGFVKELPELEELSGRVRVGGNAASFMSFCAHLAEETDSTGYWNWVIPEVEFGEIFEFLTSQPVQEASSEAISNAALVLHAIQPDWSGEPLLAHTVQQFKRVDLDDQNDVRRSLDVIDTFWPNGRIALSAVANFGELSRVILLAIRKGDKRNVGRLLWLQLQLGPALSDLLQQTPRTEEAIQGIRRVLADSSQYLEAIESQCEYVKRDGLEAIDHLAESDDLIRQWSDALILICKRTNS